MSDLDMQIREYIDATSQPLTIDDVVGEPIGLIAGSATQRSRAWAVAVASAALVLVVLGVLPWLLRSPGVDEPAGPPPSPSVSTPEATDPEIPMTSVPEPTSPAPGETDASGTFGQPVPVLTVLDVPPGWTRVSHNETVFPTGSSIDVVTAGGPGLVAFGSTCDRERRDCELASWTSGDGLVWELHPIGGQGQIVDAVSGDLGLVAVGISSMVVDADAEPPTQSCVPAVWFSENGVSWEPVSTVSHPNNAFDSGTGSSCSLFVNGVTNLEGRLVAVGYAMGTATAVWVSDDGHDWRRVAEDGGVWGRPGDAWLEDVFVVGNRLIATGGECNTADVGVDAAVCYGAAWTSTDEGTTWTRVDQPGFYGPPDQDRVGGYLGATTVWHDQLLSLATACSTYSEEGVFVFPTDCVPVAWTTRDGVTWTRRDLDPSIGFASRNGLSIRHLIAIDQTLYALGEGPATDTNHMWISSDGLTWTEETINEPVLATAYDTGITDVTLIGSGFIAVGSAPSPSPTQWARNVPAIWTWNPTN